MSDTPFTNGLKPDELERLALLAEEAAEVIQVVNKIIRHGYESSHPDSPTVTNRVLLERELGDFKAAANLMFMNGDVNPMQVIKAALDKADRMRKWLHHQGRF